MPPFIQDTEYRKWNTEDASKIKQEGWNLLRSSCTLLGTFLDKRISRLNGQVFY